MVSGKSPKVLRYSSNVYLEKTDKTSIHKPVLNQDNHMTNRKYKSYYRNIPILCKLNYLTRDIYIQK